MKRVIGLDMDSVLNNMEEVWINRYNADFGDNITTEDMTSWEPEVYCKKATRDQMFDYLKEPEFFLNLDPKPGAIKVTEFLVQHFDVWVISATSKWTFIQKIDWLEKYFPHIPSGRFIPLYEKHMFRLDYLVDDGPHNIEKCAHALPIIFDMRYNRHLTDPRYVRYKNWAGIGRFFNNEAKVYGADL